MRYCFDDPDFSVKSLPVYREDVDENEMVLFKSVYRKIVSLKSASNVAVTIERPILTTMSRMNMRLFAKAINPIQIWMKTKRRLA